MNKEYMNIRGEKAEEQACRHLRKLGYKIVARNWHSFFGEIDIIARDDDTLVFIEVKSRHSLSYGSPEESLTPEKQKRIIATACIYLNQIEDQVPVRFDFVSIHKGNVTLYQNAFQID
jgi:putative endonuclease